MTRASKFAQPFRDYEIVARLGSGGMGTVFKARRKSDQQLVALKVLRPSLSRNARYVERLRREAQISMRLDHPGLVKGYGLGEEGGYHYLVMEYVEGRTLKSLLKTWGRFPEEQVVDLGIQIADALAYAHAHGVVHRDIKPGNIIVDDEDRAKLTDLGLAKGESDPTLTRDGATVGTPQYMSPEQARDPGAVDERSDLYSLGATLYHMAVGLPPFEGESVVEVISKLLHERADSAGSLNPELSTGLSLILRRLLAKDPKLRYQSAGELRDDLVRVRDGQAPRVDLKALDRAERPRRRSRPLRIAVAAAALAGLSAVAWILAGERPEAGPTVLDDLRIAVRDANKPLAARWSMLRSYRPGEAEADAVAELRAYLLAEYRERLDAFEREVSSQVFENWLAEHGLGSWPDHWNRLVRRRLLAHLEVSGPAELPPPVERDYRERIDRLEKGWRERWRAAYDRALVAFEHEVRALVTAATERALEQGDYRTAYAILESVLADPWGLEGLSPEVRLPEALRVFPESLRHWLVARQSHVLRMASGAVREFETGVTGLLDRALGEVEAGFLDRARGLVQDARRRAQGPAPWRSLPEHVAVDRTRLARRLSAVENAIEQAARKIDSESLEVLEDTVHRILAGSLDVERALAVVRRWPLETEAVKQRARAFADDLERLQAACRWLLDRLATGGGRRSLWLTDRVLDATVVGAGMRPVPHVVVRERGGAPRTIRLADFDRGRLVETFRPQADDPGLAIGLGLLLFYSDRFDDAFVLLEEHHVEDYLARKRRRLAWLAARSEDLESRARRVFEHAEAVLADRAGLARRLDALVQDLAQLTGRFAKTRWVAEHRERIGEMQRIAETERRRLELAARLPEELRRDAIVTPFSLDGDDYLRVSLDFAEPGRFARGVGAWIKTDDGLVPGERNPTDPHRELDVPLQIVLPVIAPQAPVEIVVEFTIPESGRGAELIAFDLFGSRLAIAQPRGTQAVVLPDPGGDPVTALARRLEDPHAASGFYLVAGAGYRVRILLGASQGLQRSFTAIVDGSEVAGGRLRVPLAPDSTLAIAVTGGFVLQRVRVEGRERVE